MTKKQKIELLETAQINYEKKTGRKYDKRTKYEVYNELKKIDDTIQVTIPPTSNLKKIFHYFHYRAYQIQKQFFVMKMDIMYFMKVIDLDFVILIKNGIEIQ